MAVKLSASDAWEATSAFIRRHAGLVFTVALATLALPSILASPWLGEFQRAMMTTGDIPEDMAAVALPIFLVILLISLVGSLAVYTLALRPGVSVGESLGHALRRLLPAIGVTLLLGLAFALLTIPVVLVAGPPGGGQASPVAGVLLILLIPVAIYLVARVYLAQVAVVDGLGPVQAIRHSWAITRGNVLRLIVLLVVVFIVAFIVYLAATFILGGLFSALGRGLGGPDLGTFLAAAVGSILSALVTAVILVLVAQIYRQLAGDGPAAPIAGTTGV